MSRRYRTQQKTLPIVAVTKNAAIDLMYSGEPKTLRNRRHIAAVFAPATIGPLQLLVFLVVCMTVSMFVSKVGFYRAFWNLKNVYVLYRTLTFALAKRTSINTRWLELVILIT